MSENRQRVSIPIRGLDTSSTDINAADGAMQELHNLRYSGEAWRNVKPFKVVERFRITTKAANLIECGWDASTGEPYIKSRFPVASDIVITAYWYDVDGEYTSTTTATLHVGEQSVAIDESQESFGWIEIDVKEDDYFLYYTPKDSAPIIPSLDDEIIYQHPADEEDVYIARRVQADGTITLLRASIKYGTYTILGVIAEGLPSDITISHFGRALHVGCPTDKTITSFLLLHGEYIKFQKPTPPRITHSRYLSTNGRNSDNSKCNAIELFIKDSQEGIHDEIPFFDLASEGFMTPVFINDYFYGEICYFAAYEMEDGQIISVSPLSISSSEPFSYAPEDWGYYGSLKTDTSPSGVTITKGHLAFNYPLIEFKMDGTDCIGYIRTTHDEGGTREPNNANALQQAPASCGFAIKPLIQISIPADIDQTLIKRVNVYSTRVNSLFSAEAIMRYKSDIIDGAKGRLGYTLYGIGEFMADNELPKQPFYLMKSIPINQFSNGIYEMYITAELLENIEHKKAYEAIGMHEEYYDGSIEYNSRLHAFGNGETFLYQPESPYDITEGNATADIYTYLNIDQESYAVKSAGQGVISLSFVGNRILSYPDYRAIYIRQENNEGETKEITLKPSQANNVSWAINDKATINTTPNVSTEGSTDRNRPTIQRLIKNYAYFSDVASTFNGTLEESSIVDAKNKIRVSAANNPFVWPLANSYTIGTEDNEIIAVNAAALEMSDAKFGEFPLYVFTKEGIFAMQSGSGEVLYSAIVPLNYDRIINPHTLAVNYNVLYITSRGVHALHSNESALISEPINDEANRPLLDFLTNAKMAYQHKFGEVIFYNNDRANGVFKYPNAYTFSLGAKVWATRDWNAEGDLYTRELLNSGVMIQQGDGFAILSDIHEEESTGTTKCHFLSRPMKFNNQEFKRVETLIARLQADPSMEVHVELQASNNLTTWLPCRDITGSTRFDLNIRRTPFSARYFRVAFDCTAKGDLSFMGFDFEYYMRFLHRMR